MRIFLEAELRKKHDAFSTRSWEVNKIIDLPLDEFESFRQDLLEPRSFIKENAAVMTTENGTHHCLLVMGEGCMDGILVNSCGHDFAYFSAFIPNARQIAFMEQRYNCIQDLESNLTEAAEDVISQALVFKGDGFMRIPVDGLDIDNRHSHILADMLRENSLFKEVKVKDDRLIISVNRQEQKETPRHRPSEEKVEIMCAKHYLWLYEQVGGEQADFTGMDLSDHDLMFKRLDEAVFRDSIMHNVEMKEGSFTGCDFTGAEFISTLAYASIFDESDFTGAKLDQSNFQKASMVNCVFNNADFGSTEFNNAVLDNSDLTGAKTGFANFTDTRVDNCTGLQAEPDGDEDHDMTMQ